MYNNNSQFDKALHDRLSTEELPFDPMAWEMMEERLDEKPKRGFLFWLTNYRYLIGSLSVLLIATIAYWSFHYNNFDDRTRSEVVSISNSKLNTTTEKNTTSEPATITTNQPNTKSLTTSIKSNKSLPAHTKYKEKKSEIINKPISNVINDVINKSSVKNNTIVKEQVPKITKNYLKITDENKKIVTAVSTAQITKIESVQNIMHQIEKAAIKKEKINELTTIGIIETSALAYDSAVDFDIDIAKVEEKIDRPKHQLNMTIGAGMTQLDIDDPIVGNIKPTAISNQEAFLSLSYLHRMHRNWGIEIGAQAAYQSQTIAHYFQEGEYGFKDSEYSKASSNVFETSHEFFSNIHFFLPLNQRSELNIYGGYYAFNPLSGQINSSRGTSVPSVINRNVDLINMQATGRSGNIASGRIKLGINYNFLTNKLNNIGIGVAYMHQLENVTEGNYTLIQTTEEAAVSGKFRANSSGLKVQMTYGFGLKRFPWNKKTTKKTSTKLKNPWYIGLRYGIKKYIFNDDLSRDLIGANSNRTQSIYAGHYIHRRMAFEFGLAYSEFVFSTPTGPSSYRVKRQNLISIPFALKYDLLQTDRVSLYGKGVFTTDFRIDPRRKYLENETGFITDDNNLLLNAGIEAGIDFRIFEGVNIGFVGKYNHAFSKAALYQYPELSAQNEIVFRDINLKNTYFSWGVELKYLFNRHKKG